MDPITLIVLALAAGATAGLQAVASSAVTDAYASLKSLVKKRLAGQQDGEMVLNRYESAPQVWEAPLAQELTNAGAADDSELIAAAQAIMTLTDEAGHRAGKYTVDARGAQGVQIGEHGKQHNIFGKP
jgi:hypothetical protein